MSLPFISAAEVAQRLSAVQAVDALEAALLAGLDPEAEPPRGRVELAGGQLLVMPSAAADRRRTHMRRRCAQFARSNTWSWSAGTGKVSMSSSPRPTSSAAARRHASRSSTGADQLVTLSELVRGEAGPARDRPRLFKSTGMSWEDAVVASSLVTLP